MWEARSTPEDKQFNYMHNEKDIIGHITGNYVTDFSGNKLDDKLSWEEAGSPKTSTSYQLVFYISLE